MERALTPTERTLLEFMIEPVASDELAHQVAHATVAAACTCGCPSIGLSTTAPPITEDAAKQLSDVGRENYFAASAWGTDSTGRDVRLLLHVIDGKVAELEIWSGWDGGPVSSDLPAPHTWRRKA
jgi:hypothetical protein